MASISEGGRLAGTRRSLAGKDQSCGSAEWGSSRVRESVGDAQQLGCPAQAEADVRELRGAGRAGSAGTRRGTAGADRTRPPIAGGGYNVHHRQDRRIARLPRRSLQGLIVNLSAQRAITVLAAVLLVAVCIPVFSVRALFPGRGSRRRPVGWRPRWSDPAGSPMVRLPHGLVDLLGPSQTVCRGHLPKPDALVVRQNLARANISPRLRQSCRRPSNAGVTHGMSFAVR
jgi:hypothetical protein